MLCSSPLRATSVKLVPSPSLSFCAGRPSTALWTRAPHPKVASPAPTTTQSWGCTIPKMTFHSEKQVGLRFSHCAADRHTRPSDLILLKKIWRKASSQKTGDSRLCFVSQDPSPSAPPSPVIVLPASQGAWGCPGLCKERRRQRSRVSKFGRCFPKSKARAEIRVSPAQVGFSE